MEYRVWDVLNHVFSAELHNLQWGIIKDGVV